MAESVLWHANWAWVENGTLWEEDKTFSVSYTWEFTVNASLRNFVSAKEKRAVAHSPEQSLHTPGSLGFCAFGSIAFLTWNRCSHSSLLHTTACPWPPCGSNLLLLSHLPFLSSGSLIASSPSHSHLSLVKQTPATSGKKLHPHSKSQWLVTEVILQSWDEFFCYLNQMSRWTKIKLTITIIIRRRRYETKDSPWNCKSPNGRELSSLLILQVSLHIACVTKSQ
jgi:hypothetical protein